MELDKRVNEGRRPLTCFDLKEASDFLEKTGYFTNELDNFSDLSETGCFSEVRFGRLLKINNNKGSAFKYLSMDGSYENSYRFFLPEEWVLPKEKTYRPYKNVQELFEDVGVYIGDVIQFKAKVDMAEYHSLITGWTETKNGITTICFGYGLCFTMQELFDSFELRSRGEWQPFGIEAKEGD